MIPINYTIAIICLTTEWNCQQIFLLYFVQSLVVIRMHPVGCQCLSYALVDRPRTDWQQILQFLPSRKGVLGTLILFFAFHEDDYW